MPWTKGFIESLDKKDHSVEPGRTITYVEAIREALEFALSNDSNVFLMGQGVDDPNAMFGTTKDLQKKFGDNRVFDTPLSEEALTGFCVGAAMEGLRPIYMHNRPDFLLLTMNQIVNHASKMHYMDNGATKVPLVIWSAIGRGWGSGPQHSQAIQGLLLGVPGLKIIMPSTPFDAKGLLLSAIADNNPVLVFEHRWVMRGKGNVPANPYTIPIGKAAIRKAGEDLTIIGSSHILEIAIAALEETPNVSAEVIDLRTIKPLDTETILKSVQKTKRALILDTGWSMGGVCAEIGCLIAENVGNLRNPIQRIGLPDIPSPAGFALEQFYYPNIETVKKAINKIFAR